MLALLWLGSALAGAALLRAGARIFLGWGDADDPLLGKAMEEDPLERDVLRPLLVGVALDGGRPRLGDQRRARARAARRVRGDRFRDTSGYAARVLHGRACRRRRACRSRSSTRLSSRSSTAMGATILALGLALVGLYRRRLPRSVSLGRAPDAGAARSMSSARSTAASSATT